MKNNKLIFGLLAGVAVGAILGLLLAPDKGSETRKKVFREGEDLADDLKKKFEDLLHDLGVGFDTREGKQNGSSETQE